ncbi:MAG: ATP-binding cassette domain-containing protein [Polyangiaceae bacterium]|nr:ATP-binding cassette domain-containing protein [Polyangiaceae bacterium]
MILGDERVSLFTMSEELIRFTNVKKRFGPKIIYRDLDLSIRRGEIFTVLGGSGVGKSVMLKMLIGLLRVDSGSINFDGKEVTTMQEAELSLVRRRICMLFQSGALFDSLSVGENVRYGLDEHFQYSMTAVEKSERVAWALGLVGLPGIESMSPADLSGGMRKRVGLARAIAVQPEVILYDEPTTGLDPINTARVNHMIMGLQEKLNFTSIVVTHDMGSAFTVSDRMAMVHSGRIIAQGTKEEFRAIEDKRVRDFIQGRAPVQEDVLTLLNA